MQLPGWDRQMDRRTDVRLMLQTDALNTYCYGFGKLTCYCHSQCTFKLGAVPHGAAQHRIAPGPDLAGGGLGPSSLAWGH